MKLNKLILAGGTGFLGQAIINKFSASCNRIIVLTRGAERTDKNVTYLHWDGKTTGKWAEEIDGADVLINLTGKSVDCRYTAENKAEILSSRINAAKVLGIAVNNAQNPPKLWMNAASATIYRNAEDRAMDEYDGEYGSGFSVEVCKAWEKAFDDVVAPRTRKITIRISMVLGKGGGVMPVLKKLVKFGLGGTMGKGTQYISWIHEEDFVNALAFFIEHETSAGAYNLAAPDPMPNREFMAVMRKKMNRSIGLPAAEWMLEIGAFFLRTETELILKSRRVVPTKLLKEGFVFVHPQTEEALENLLN